MKHRCILVCLVVAALASCEKTSDVTPLADEARGVVAYYKARLDDQKARADALLQRGRAIGASSVDATAATRLFSETGANLRDLDQVVAQTPSAIDAAAKAGNAAELRKLLYTQREKLEAGSNLINARLDAVESWIANAEAVAARPVAAPPTPAPPPDEPPQVQPIPEPPVIPAAPTTPPKG